MSPIGGKLVSPIGGKLVSAYLSVAVALSEKRYKQTICHVLSIMRTWGRGGHMSHWILMFVRFMYFIASLLFTTCVK